jgi:putative transposase
VGGLWISRIVYLTSSLVAFYRSCRIKMQCPQQKLPLRTWGGRRSGAGREPSGLLARVSHARRAVHEACHPVHVTLRAIPGLPSLRTRDLFPHLCRCIAAMARAEFRVVQFSVQSNHVHLLVEASDGRSLRRGVQGLTIRLARAINRRLGRAGRVWSDRYHSRELRTPREVRNGLVYVLLNGRKHGVCGPGIDPLSSGPWFSGWREGALPPPGPSPIAQPRTWLLRIGWRRSASISIVDAPSRTRSGNKVARVRITSA